MRSGNRRALAGAERRPQESPAAKKIAPGQALHARAGANFVAAADVLAGAEHRLTRALRPNRAPGGLSGPNHPNH